ncbi:MAG: peptidyl-prolyl cis-trans isomerase [Balneolaceae bacterium]
MIFKKRPFHDLPILAVFFSWLIILSALSSCEPFQNDEGNPVLARVGEDELTLQQALLEIPEIVLQRDTLEAVEAYQNSWIDRKVIEKEAVRIGLDRDPEFIRKMNRQRAQLLENALKDLIVSEQNENLEVTREEAQNYYQIHKDRFILDERYVRFRYVTTRTRVEADNARRDIMRGIPWPDVVRSYSINPELRIRESENFVPESQALADIPIMNHYLANRIGITEISPIRQIGDHYHFVQLMEVKAEGDHPDLNWLIEQIREWLRLEKTQRLVNSYVRNLYLQAEANNEIERINVREIRQPQLEEVQMTEEN